MEPVKEVGEFFKDCMEGHQSVYTANQRKFLKRAVEFAKLHAKAALEAAKTQAQKFNTEYTCDSILSAYPLENIK